MRIAIAFLAVTVAFPVFGQQAPKQSPFAFEMPKKAEPAATKAKTDKAAEPNRAVKDESKAGTESKEKSEEASPAPVPTSPVAAEPQIGAAEATSAATAVPAPEPATPAQPSKSVALKVAPTVGSDAALARPGKSQKAKHPDPLNFRLPNTDQAPAKRTPDAQKSDPFTFELPDQKPAAEPKS